PRARAVRSRAGGRRRPRRALRDRRARGACRARAQRDCRPPAPDAGRAALVTARFCLRCGARLVSAREGGHHRRRCRRCGWTYYGNPVPACAALVMAGGRLLLARRARPPYARMWDLPGGFLEAGEDPPRALRRELREEIGVSVRRARLLGFASDRYGPGGVIVLSAVYRVVPTS